MTIYNGKKISDKDMVEIASYMRDDIREDIHATLSPCTYEGFIVEYIKRDSEFVELLENVFDWRA